MSQIQIDRKDAMAILNRIAHGTNQISEGLSYVYMGLKDGAELGMTSVNLDKITQAKIDAQGFQNVIAGVQKAMPFVKNFIQQKMNSAKP